MGAWFNRIVLLVALTLGVIGAWTLREGVSQYVDTSRAFADVAIDYEPGSFVWLEPDGTRAQFTLLATNDSDHEVIFESLDVHLYFDNDFAGTNYEAFQSLPLPAGESRPVDVTVLVTAKSKLDKAGTAELYLNGTADFRFTDIKPVRALDVIASIGVAPLPATSGAIAVPGAWRP